MNKLISRLASAGICVIMCIFASVLVYADNSSCQTGTAKGSYRDPQTSTIEDSGGEANYALGQSMVENVVGDKALLEQQGDIFYLSLRFNLASNLSKIELATQQPNESQWTTAQTTQTCTGDDSVDLRIQVKSKDTIVKATCYVDAMGRSVIFFITVSDYTDGNTAGFAEAEKTTIQSNTSQAQQTISTQSGSSQSENILSDAQGLTVGTNSSDTQSTAQDNSQITPTENSSTAQNTSDSGVQSNTLTLVGGTWWLIFAVAFCGSLLAGLLLRVLDYFILKKKPKNRTANSQNHSFEDENDDINITDLDLWGDGDEN